MLGVRAGTTSEASATQHCTPCFTGRVDGDVAIESHTTGQVTGGCRGIISGRTGNIRGIPEGRRGLEIHRVGRNTIALHGLRACEHVQETVVGGHVHIDTVHFGSHRDLISATLAIDEVRIGLGDRVVLLHDHTFQALRTGREAGHEGHAPEQGLECWEFHVLGLLDLPRMNGPAPVPDPFTLSRGSLRSSCHRRRSRTG